MGRTFEALNGRTRKAAAGDEPVASIPFPTVASEPMADNGPTLVPMTADDLPGDDDQLPHVEVGGPRVKPAATAAPTLVAPKTTPTLPMFDVGFQLLTRTLDKPREVPAEIVAYHRPDHPDARQYRLLADGIAAQHGSARSPVFLFTPASHAASGTSTIANLAATRAADGFGRVLIVEVERSAASTSERLGVPSAPGLREILGRSVPMSMALHRTAMDGVHVLPAGRGSVGTVEAERLPELLDVLRARFDWVLVEAPVWGTYPLDDWATACDGTYLVLRPDEWDSPHADQAVEAISRGGGRLRGCVTTGEERPAPARASLDERSPRRHAVRRPGDE